MIGFLHTSPVHVATFQQLVAERDPAAQIESVVDEALLSTAIARGVDHPLVGSGVADAIERLAAGGAELVVCTCSTIGGLAERIGAAGGVRVIRVDRPMAERAIDLGGRIAVIAAVESTLDPTAELLRTVAGERDVDPDLSIHLVAGAWERFEAGDVDGYLDLVAGRVRSVAADADVVVLAQASMAAAAERAGVDVPVLSSPRPAVEAAVAALRRT